MNNKDLLKQIHLSQNHSPSTMKAYQLSVNIYCNYFEMTLHDLLTEAEEEEQEKVKWKLSTLKRRLIEFRHYLLENYAYNSYIHIFNTVITIYKYYDIEVGELPKINQKSVKKPRPLTYDDLPTRKIIQEAINISSPLMKALILFMSSSGCAIQEATNLKIKDYLNSIKDYTDKKDLFEAINDIKDRKDVVPTWNIWRQKTNKYYTTYSTPESVNAINSYLISRKDNFNDDSKLFNYNKHYIQQRFIGINNELGLGKVGDTGYNRFRSHMLRKFHASALYNDGMSMDTVNELQGKSKSRTDSSYFMENPRKLKEKYVEHMGVLMVNSDFMVDMDSVGYDDLRYRILRLEKLLYDNMDRGELELLDRFF